QKKTGLSLFLLNSLNIRNGWGSHSGAVDRLLGSELMVCHCLGNRHSGCDLHAVWMVVSSPGWELQQQSIVMHPSLQGTTPHWSGLHHKM
uniref:Uncharacterized protein n=1 Tax=Gopherus evgoodei TaxID=1825980 RepID=A0A8C4W1N8_9SAUR